MFFFLIMMAIAFGLALPFTAYWLYDAMREKSVKRRFDGAYSYDELGGFFVFGGVFVGSYAHFGMKLK